MMIKKLNFLWMEYLMYIVKGLFVGWCKILFGRKNVMIIVIFMWMRIVVMVNNICGV